MISVARGTMRNSQRWQDGTMKKRWVAAGMVEAQRSFLSLRGCKTLPTLLAALRRHAAGESVAPTNYDQSAA